MKTHTVVVSFTVVAMDKEAAKQIVTRFVNDGMLKDGVLHHAIRSTMMFETVETERKDK